MFQVDRIADDPAVRGAAGADLAPGQEVAHRPVKPPAAAGAWFDWLMAPTGPGAVEDYLDHPLTFARRAWVARIVRGLTGLLGDTKLGVVDVLVGVLEGWLERRRPPVPPASPNGSVPGA